MKKVLTVAICIVMAISMCVSGYATENIARGQRGEGVREVQALLMAQGYSCGASDGVFGARTEEAVRAFQQSHGLDVTGIVGAATYDALKQAPAAQATAADASDIDCAAVFPSWYSDSASLQALVQFVANATDESSAGYIVPEDRIATFDMDGTILCEKAPVYIDWCLTMHRVLDDPTYNATEEALDSMRQIRAHAYTNGETFTPEGIGKNELVASAFAGMTPEAFRAYVADFADKADAVGFAGMTYSQSFYKPMIEVINYLKANDFDVWMVSACEREVVRALVERLGIPFDHVIATDVPYVASGNDGKPADEYDIRSDEDFVLGEPLDEVECGKSGKPAAIVREIGKRPVLAFGNSSGDYSMLNYAKGNTRYAGMGFFVVCDDVVREYGSAEAAAKYYDKVAAEGWTAISMGMDWKDIYGEGVRKTGLPGVEEAKLSDAA